VKLAVDFDSESGLIAVEVDHVRPDGVLPAEPKSEGSPAQTAPEQTLGARHVAAEAAAAISRGTTRVANRTRRQPKMSKTRL